MYIVNTTRDNIIDRYQGREHRFPYFFYEDDPTESEYSKFVYDELYDDDNVQWGFIAEDNKIFGICAFCEEDDEYWIKFIEIANGLRGHGYGAEAIACLINKTDKHTVKLYPRDEELGTNFYKTLGFKWFGDEMFYLK